MGFIILFQAKKLVGSCILMFSVLMKNNNNKNPNKQNQKQTPKPKPKLNIQHSKIKLLCLFR